MGSSEGNIAMINRTLLSSSSLLALAVSLVACGGSVRVVNVAPSGGELALEGEREMAHAEAESYMSRHCPRGHDVLHDGMEYIGTKSAATVPLYGASAGWARANQTEWRLQYRCSGQPPTTPAAESPTPEPKAAAPAPAPPPALAPEADAAPTPPTTPRTPPNDWF
jgi:hypothetical protein